MPKVYLLRGLPGSGKTTYAQDVLKADIIIEADDYFNRGGAYRFNAAQLPQAHANAQERFREAISDPANADKTIAACNTFSRRWELAPYMTACNRAGVRFTVLRMEGDFQSVHNVPQTALDNMRRRFEDVTGEIKINPGK